MKLETHRGRVMSEVNCVRLSPLSYSFPGTLAALAIPDSSLHLLHSEGPLGPPVFPLAQTQLDILCRQKLPLHSTHSFIALISKFFVLVVSYILSRFLVGFSFSFIFPRWEGKACPYLLLHL